MNRSSAGSLRTDCVVVDDALRFGLCSHDCAWAGRASEQFLSNMHLVSKNVYTQLVDQDLQEANVGQQVCGFYTSV